MIRYVAVMHVFLLILVKLLDSKVHTSVIIVGNTVPIYTVMSMGSCKKDVTPVQSAMELRHSCINPSIFFQFNEAAYFIFAKHLLTTILFIGHLCLRLNFSIQTFKLW